MSALLKVNYRRYTIFITYLFILLLTTANNVFYLYLNTVSIVEKAELFFRESY